jgi:hypothetical protein
MPPYCSHLAHLEWRCSVVRDVASHQGHRLLPPLAFALCSTTHRLIRPLCSALHGFGLRGCILSRSPAAHTPLASCCPTLRPVADPEIKLSMGEVTEVTKSKTMFVGSFSGRVGSIFIFPKWLLLLFFTPKSGSKQLLLSGSRHSLEDPELKPERSLAKRGLSDFSHSS